MTNPIRYRTGAGLTALLMAGAIAACGTETINAEDLENQLAEQLAPQLDLDPEETTVDCPEDEEPEEGRTFTCTLTPAGGGEDLTVEVRLTDDEGGFSAQVQQQ